MIRRLVPAGVAGAVTVLMAALLLGRSAYPVLGLADPGELVRLGLPVVRVAAAGAAAVALGVLTRAVVLADGADGPSAGERSAGSAAAWTWAVLSLAAAVLTVADVSGGLAAPGPDLVVQLVVRAAPVGWLATAAGAAVVAVWVREARSWSSTLGAGLLACVALLGPVVTGHAIDGVGKDLGTPAVGLHVVAATVWLGTIGALLVAVPDDEAVRARFVARAGAVATVCAVVTVLSGVLAAAVLVPSVGELATAYGVLVLLAAAVTVVVLGVLVRRRLAIRRRGFPATGCTPYRRAPLDRSAGTYASLELVLLAVVTGLSVAMTRAVPPVQAPFHTTPTEAVLGFGIPDQPSVGTLVGAWRPDVVLVTLAVVLAGVYGRWLRRVAGWPTGRAVAWFAGCAVLVLASSSGLGRYADALFSAHVAEHMLLSIVVPVLLVLGGPVTLARRALPEEGDTQRSGASRQDARDRLEALLDAPALRLLAHPAVAAVLVVGSPFLLYLTPAFSLLQPLGWLMPAISLWFLGVGYLFFWVLVGVDPAPGPRLPHVARLAVLVASMPFHALFGVILLAADRPVAQIPSTLAADGGGGQVFVTDFYSHLRLPWAVDLLADQHVAALLAWGMGDVPLLAVVVVLLVQWHREGAAEDAATRDLLART
ncbi:cytochrome c oxidase assembly protein [Actinomycetospora sp. TBRC 11914]|uniref:cytochrome c oxidase assembly protein n=1 Tax=Actinomycetospora sp. TBRC 11914 TaxID=2729387 RepID=UPI00145E5670|nr:cytochrome c oxidase assembly protein [Actinomycetospora sp. TBRC 11914]NMO92789.1 cytochrome c oxidase assembly protein [Actinomycetospora sp. TBRC 11914]